jgi:hypothetical protein
MVSRKSPLNLPLALRERAGRRLAAQLVGSIGRSAGFTS